MKSVVAIMLVSAPLLFGPAVAPIPRQQAAVSAAVELAQARELLRIGNRTEAETVCKEIVKKLAPVDLDPNQRQQLAGAYEVLAVVHHRDDKKSDAAVDFTLLLKAYPAYPFGRDVPVSKPELTSFAQTKAGIVGVFKLDVIPANAEVSIDGEVIEKRPVEVEVLTGSTHTVSARLAGYIPAVDKKYVVAVPTPDEPQVLRLDRRLSSTFEIVTAPAGVEVRLNHGPARATPGGTPPPPFAESIRSQPQTSESFSGVLTLSDVESGESEIEFKKDCFQPTTLKKTVQAGEHDDFKIAMVLKREYATVNVTGGDGGTIWVGDQKRGTAPQEVANVCAGDRVLEVVTAGGRSVHRLDGLIAGVEREVHARPRPAVAILSMTGQPNTPGDLRVTVERALPSATVTIFAPTLRDGQAALPQNLRPGWLAFDLARRPVLGSQAASMSSFERRQRSVALAKDLNVQGVAEITVPSPQEQPRRILLTILAADSGVPDVIPVDLDNVDKVLADLSAPPQLFELSIGTQLADVLDAPGPAVVKVFWAAADRPFLEPGDIITHADGRRIPDTATFNDELSKKTTGQSMMLTVNGSAGTKQVKVVPVARPRVIGIDDETVLANKLLLDYTSVYNEASAPDVKNVALLNLAVALMKIGNWSEARGKLEQVTFLDKITLADNTTVDYPGVSNGTVQYLIGLCFENSPSPSRAETAYLAARDTKAFENARLTTDGPLIRELAAAKLDPNRRR